MRTAARVDNNQSKIVESLRSVGCTVQSLAAVGRGCPDLLCGINGRNFVMEVKDGNKPPSARQLTPEEAIWHNEWKGQKAVVNSVAEALEVIGAKLQ